MVLLSTDVKSDERTVMLSADVRSGERGGSRADATGRPAHRLNVASEGAALRDYRLVSPH